MLMITRMKMLRRKRVILYPDKIIENQVEMKQSSTPVLLAVRRRGEDEVSRRKRREEDDEKAFTSLPNQHKLRRQR